MTVERSWIPLVCIAVLVVATMACIFTGNGGTDKWVNVPRDTHEYDLLPGEEGVIRGFLEANDRIILAIPEQGDPGIISEDEVDQLIGEGLGDKYNFIKPGWTHRIQLNETSLTPSLKIEGLSYYVIVSSGTETWKSSDVLEKFAGKEVEMKGKWGSFPIPGHPLSMGVTQFRPRSIREVRDQQ